MVTGAAKLLVCRAKMCAKRCAAFTEKRDSTDWWHQHYTDFDFHLLV